MAKKAPAVSAKKAPAPKPMKIPARINGRGILAAAAKPIKG